MAVVEDAAATVAAVGAGIREAAAEAVVEEAAATGSFCFIDDVTFSLVPIHPKPFGDLCV